MKREILVHDCGHIVNPGDEIAIEVDDQLRLGGTLAVGYRYKLVKILPNNGSSQNGARYLLLTGSYDGTEYIRSIERFNCTIMEIDDEEVHPSS